MMKKTSIPQQIDTWVLDLDNTIYSARSNLFDQIDVRMGDYIATTLKLDLPTAKKIQKQYLMEHGTTLKGLMINHDIKPESFLDYVHDIDITGIHPDPKINDVFHRLPGRKIIYTNGTQKHANRILDHLNITHHFDQVFDIIASDYVPKPAAHALSALVETHEIDAEKSVMIDDMAVNLKPAHHLGMTTVWIKTDSPFGTHESDGDHIHHVADDLYAWFDTYLEGKT